MICEESKMSRSNVNGITNICIEACYIFYVTNLQCHLCKTGCKQYFDNEITTVVKAKYQ